ncbi:MAG: hypothetical protein M1838_002352 [Thelocarpon superellum]|nr:MAG: hypothetical protein M1838_002352 [Thelocarpon superellum]
MAKSKSKGKAAGHASSTASSTAGGRSHRNRHATVDPPAPFTRPSAALEAFLSTLSPANIYLTHLDTHPPAFKRQVWLIPLCTNLAIVLLLAWRVYAIAPSYWSLLESMMGQPNADTVDVDHLPKTAVGRIIVSRAAMFLVDWILWTYVFAWPQGFFFGQPANPLLWRHYVRFEPREVVVRVSRRWAESLTHEMNMISEEGDPVLREKLLPAMDRAWMASRTGYMMLAKDWDLDYQSMLTAHELVADGTLAWDDFQKSVFVHVKECGWLVWKAWKLDEGSEEAGRRKIVAFKDRLTALGKESLFFRWIELVQFESSQPGGFTPDRQADTVRQAKELFEKEGIDFDAFWSAVGGMEGMPGLEGPST